MSATYIPSRFFLRGFSKCSTHSVRMFSTSMKEEYKIGRRGRENQELSWMLQAQHITLIKISQILQNSDKIRGM